MQGKQSKSHEKLAAASGTGRCPMLKDGAPLELFRPSPNGATSLSAEQRPA